MKKPRRSLSGVAVIAVMAPSFNCPGECLFCFRGEDAAQSYTGKEPSARRALRHNYDPYEITRARIEQLESNGHPTDKLDVIIMGGTFNAFPRGFQADFVKKIFDACNGSESKTLQEAQEKNEKAGHRIIGLTFETRPDWATQDELNWLLGLGGTRLELGVQTTLDDVLEFNKRGHLSGESIRATADARDLGFKVGYHIMPGLPGSSPEKDLRVFEKIFTEDFMPDMLKIYPTIVVPGSRLEKLHESGEFNPMDEESVVELLAKAKLMVPPWTRIMRIQRDVPAPEIGAGIKKGNIREMVWNRMEAPCECIRCREVKSESDIEPKLHERRYMAGGAEEVFISFEDGKLVGFVRLRLLRKFLRPELKGAAIIREIRVLGPEARIGKEGLWQHRGYGKKLMVEAEKAASRAGYTKMAVISGIGVRDYFRKIGYRLEGVYMVKLI